MSEAVFLVPDVGEGLIEAEIVAWKVEVGDVVTLNQPLVDIETAKATVELPSPYAGTVTARHGEVGDVMAVGAPLVVFDVGESPASPAPVETENTREAVLVGYGVKNDEVATTRRRRHATPPTAPASTPPAAPSRAPRSTPPVRLYAKQRGVDLARVTPTGRDGLITRSDVDRVSSSPSRPLPSATTTSRFVGREIESWSTGELEERIPVKGVLRSMSDAMVQSAFSAPHAGVWMTIDATRSVELLATLRQVASNQNLRVTPLTLVALAFCDAARHYPGINSSFDEAAREVVVRRSISLGIAADTPRGLVVPNVKQADQLDLVGMARALSDLVERARAGTLAPADMLGTTLSITNVGPFGVDGALPILPPGTGAILCVGQIAKRPWVLDDAVVVRHVLQLSMSFDHRQIDGALASSVLAHVGRFLEDPAARLSGL